MRRAVLVSWLACSAAAQRSPRIVNGVVIATDPAQNRLLAQVVVPMWVDVAEGQSARDFSTGQLVNFYFASGVSFTPIAD